MYVYTIYQFAIRLFTVYTDGRCAMANSKTLLQTFCQERRLQPPVYSTQREGDGSAVTGSGYSSSILVGDRRYDSAAVQSSFYLAEEDASRVAYNSLRRASDSAASRSSRQPSHSQTTEPVASRWAAAGHATAASSSCSSSSSGTSTKRTTGLASRSSAACVANGAANAVYSPKLEKLCNARGLPAPEYNVRENPNGKFSATVVVGNDEYSSSTSGSYMEAKEYASLVALAEVGLSLLNINQREDGTEENLERSGLMSRNEEPSLSHVNISRAHNMYQELPEKNYKAIVNEYCQKNYLPLPEYETDYPDDATGFVAVLSVRGKEYRSKPMSKKIKAEQNAAGKAALDIGLVTIGNGPGGMGSLNGASHSSGGGLVEKPAVNGSATSSLLGRGSVASSISSGRFSARSSGVQEGINANYKGILQEFLAKKGISNPQYSTGQSCGGKFVSTITLIDISGETLHFQGRGQAKKQTAEQAAAKEACNHYGLE